MTRRLLEEDATAFERLLLESAELDVPMEGASARLLDRLDDAPVVAVDYLRERARKATTWIALLAACLGATMIVYERTRHRVVITAEQTVVAPPTNIASPVGPPRPETSLPEPPGTVTAPPAVTVPPPPPATVAKPANPAPPTRHSSATRNTDDPPFDRGAAATALKAVDLQECKPYDGPDGSGHVSVTFESTGAVTEARVDPPFAGTPRGACVAAKYRAASVPAFSGPAVRVGKSFVIN